ncbi:MAG TPA: hypothetical protein VIJ90_00850 [Gemmatimonadaceae bacterium]
MTTSAEAIPRFFEPALAAPAGAASETASDTPDGIGSSSEAAIFWFDSFVVIAKLVPLTEALVGALLTIAVRTMIGLVVPETAAWDIDTTLNVTVWVAV